MREVTLELDGFDCPSNNQVRSMNTWVYKRLIENLKLKILHQIGEGPWPKITFEKGAYSPRIRKQVRDECKERWAPERMVMADITIRRPRKFDNDNSQGGAKPLWDALVRMGWMVDDHENWFFPFHRSQVNGDPKVVLTLHVPDTDKDEKRIKDLRGAQEKLMAGFSKKVKTT